MLVIVSLALVLITCIRFVFLLQKGENTKFLWVSLFIQLICLGGCYTFFRPLNDLLRSGSFIQNFTIEISSLIILPLILLYRRRVRYEKHQTSALYIIVAILFFISLINPLNHNNLSTLAFAFNLAQILLVLHTISSRFSLLDIQYGLMDGLKICIILQSLLVLAYPILNMNFVLSLFKGESGLYWVNRRENYTSALGTFGHPATLALFSLLAGIVFFTQYLFYRKKGELFFLFCSLFCIYFTYSRTSFVAAFITLLVTFFFYKKKQIKFSAKFIVFFLLAILLLVIILYFSPVFNLFFHSNVDEMFEARMMQFDLIPYFLRDSFWFGVGINSHVYYMSNYLSESWFLYDFFTSNPIHNTHLIILVETGIVGFVLWLGYIVSQYRKFIKRTYTTNYFFFFDLVFIATLIAVVIYSTFGWTACSKEILALIIFIGYFSFKSK